jgi:SLT domain-containing protein
MSTKAYAEGTDNAAGGWSIVGDGGRPELVLSRGKAWITPDTPTLVNLQRGDKVLPDAQAVLTGKMMSDYAMLSEQLKDKRDEGVTVNIANDHNDLRKEMELSNEQLDDIKRILRKQAHNADYMRIYARV